MMDNYEIISLEKCLRDDGNIDHMTEHHFVNLTSKMRAVRPEADVKILNYWHVMFTQIICWRIQMFGSKLILEILFTQI